MYVSGSVNDLSMPFTIFFSFSAFTMLPLLTVEISKNKKVKQ